MQKLDRTTYDDAGNPAGTIGAAALTDLINARAGRIQRSWRFNLLTFDGVTLSYKADLTPWVTTATVNHDSTRAVKRTLSMQMAETASGVTAGYSSSGKLISLETTGISYLSDWVQPVYRLRTADGLWVDWSLGCFVFTNPQTLLTGYSVQRTAQLADLTFIINREQFTTPMMLNADGTISNQAAYYSGDQTGTDPNAPADFKMDMVLPMGVPLIQIISFLIAGSPDPGVKGYFYDDTDIARTLNSLPGVGFDERWLDQAVFLPGGSIYTAKSTALLPAPYTASAGSSYMDVVNQFLYALNMDQVWATAGDPCPIGGKIGPNCGTTLTANGLVNSNGPVITTKRWPPRQNYNVAAAGITDVTYTYSTENGASIILPSTTHQFDMDKMANVITVTVTDTGQDTEVFSVINKNTSSPLSIDKYRLRIAQQVSVSGVPRTIVDGQDYQYALGIAYHEMQLASGATESVTLMTAVNAGHEDHDVCALDIHAAYVQDGQYQDPAIAVGDALNSTVHVLPGLDISDKFLETGWEISINLPSPGTGLDSATTGVTTAVEARASAPGATMSHTFVRVTALSPDGSAVETSPLSSGAGLPFNPRNPA